MKKKKLIVLALVVFLASLGTALAQGGKSSPTSGAVIFNFDADAMGNSPQGFTSYASGQEPAGRWVVLEMADAPSGKQVVEQTDPNSTDGRFPVVISNQAEYGDVEVSVKGKAISGKVDQAIGLVFRFRDPKSYYVCRANALENNVRLYKMVDGRRKQFAGADALVTSGTWHTLRVTAQGDHIVCYFDGQKLIDAHDKTYSHGKVGLWTKADSVTAFDDLTVSKP